MYINIYVYATWVYDPLDFVNKHILTGYSSDISWNTEINVNTAHDVKVDVNNKNFSTQFVKIFLFLWPVRMEIDFNFECNVEHKV